MKKLLLLACACLVASTSSFAQIIQSESKTTQTFIIEQPKEKVVKSYPRYQGEFNWGYTTPKTAFLETVHGVRINKYLFAGAGVGFHYIAEKEFDGYDGSLSDLRVPVFGNLKGYLPFNDKTAAFLNLSLGYGISIEEGSGFYCDFGAGIKHRAFTFSLGLQHHGIGTEVYYYDYYDSWYDDKIIKYNAFYLKIGLCW